MSVDNLAEQNGTPIAQLRNKVAELMTGVRHGDRLSGIRHHSPCKHFESLGTGKPIRFQPKVQRKLSIEADKLRSLYRSPESALPEHKSDRVDGRTYSQRESAMSLE